MRTVIRYGVLVIICALAVTADGYYRANEGKVFFMYSEAIADSAYDATIGAYGPGMRDRTMYIENTRDIHWVLGEDLFLSPYLGKDYRKIVWVDSFAQIDPATIDRAKSLFLRMDWSQNRLVDVTSEVLGQ